MDMAASGASVSSSGRRRAIALRSILRIVDQLPLVYVSGLVSMVRTGRARRQRIGDVAAGTIVVAVDPRASQQGTPGWMLPVVTLVALAISALSIFGIVRAGSRPLTAAQRSQFVAGCDASAAGRVMSCGCLLDQLGAAGYDTPDRLQALLEQERVAIARRDPVAMPPALIGAARVCRR